MPAAQQGIRRRRMWGFVFWMAPLGIVLVNLTLVIPQPSIALPVWMLGVVFLFGGLALVIADYLRRTLEAVAPLAAPAAEPAEAAGEPGAASGTTER